MLQTALLVTVEVILYFQVEHTYGSSPQHGVSQSSTSSHQYVNFNIR
jgi:hypothetical protein